MFKCNAKVVAVAAVLAMSMWSAWPAFAQGGGAGGGGGDPTQPKPSTPPLPVGPKTLAGMQSAQLSARRLADLATRAAKAAAAESGEPSKAAAQFLRATARSSEISAELLLAGIIRGGGKPLVDAEPPAALKATKENLAAVIALADATRQRAVTAAADARSENDAASRRILDFHREACTELARLGRELQKPAAANAKAPEYYVSRTCGYIVDRLDIARCPVCLAPKSDFEKIN